MIVFFQPQPGRHIARLANEFTKMNYHFQQLSHKSESVPIGMPLLYVNLVEAVVSLFGKVHFMRGMPFLMERQNQTSHNKGVGHE